MRDEEYMRLALAEAVRAEEAGEVPVGCVIADAQGHIVSAGNRMRADRDPTAHAEMNAIRSAAFKGLDLSICTIYVTLEPCPMCAGAILKARLMRCVYGAPDPDMGCAGSLLSIPEDPAFDWFCPCDGGVLRAECEQLLDGFFTRRRNERKREGSK